MKKEASEAEFFTLLKKTALISIDETTATIAAPSTIAINLITKRFSQIIKGALKNQTNKELKIVFVPKTIPPGRDKNLKSGDAPLFNHAAISEETNKTIVGHLPRVSADYTFKNIAVSSSNQLAYTSAVAVAKNLGKNYNPLFIYGPVGVGKTHLMQAIANDAYQKNPAIKIVYITSEEFTNDVVEAIRTNQTAGMKRKFRGANLLIIDDVQFIAGKDKVQEELFHTFNILIDNKSQIVLSSDRPPNEIKKLEKRLSSRFAGGLTVDIEPPDFELRTAILLIKAKKYGVDLPIEVAKALAEKSEDARGLEGALLRTITQAGFQKEAITPETIRKLFKRETDGKTSFFHPDEIVKKVCSFYDIKTTQITGPKRDARLVRARQIAMYLLKKELKLTYAEIGNMMGGRDHTTVMHGVEKVENVLISSSQGYEEISRITNTLRE